METARRMEQDIEAWLQSVGLAELAAGFRAQGITLDQVPELTDDDLRELGVTIGARLRLRRAAASLAQPADDHASPRDTGVVIDSTRAERRPLTMMFIDLVNSSALGERLEPEDLLEVIRAYREFAGAAINRFGGHVARLVGDGILAYFGYPAASENDPERAVRAALEITRGIGGLQTPAVTPLNVRIGIATGRVIVSDLFAGGQPDLRSIIGTTPNLAARLQGFAPADGIVIAEETHARVGAAFVCEEFGRREIRGFAQEHNAWRVIGEASAAVRKSAVRQVVRLTPFYGRQAELDILAATWERAQAGEAGTVLLLGEPGIGKSRLVEHFAAVSLGAGVQVFRLVASALDEDSTLHPVIAFLRSEAGLDVNHRQDDDLARLEAVLVGDAPTRRAAMPVLAELLGLAGDDTGLRSLPPARLRERILSVLIEQILLMAARGPLLLVVEDLHWLDPTTCELLERLLAAVAGRRMMVLLTAREDGDVKWPSLRPTVALRLRPLPPEDVLGMVRSLFVNREIPDGLDHVIANRTDGVPLFVEEVARALLAQDTLHAEPVDVAGQAIPPSLHASLAARLDKSGDAKAIAQVAAVIGRSARRDVLAAVAAVPEAIFSPMLKALRDTGILVEDAAEGIAGYSFSHALLRDAAYDSLLRDERRALHLRVAQALATHDPQTVAEQPELLAMHLTDANDAEAAAPHWLEAARRSLARSALTEATRLLRRGLQALEKMPPTERVQHHQLEMSALLGPVLIALCGPGSAEAQDLYATAYALAEQLDEHPAQFPLYWGWWRVSREIGVKKHRARTLLARAVARDDPELLLQAHHCNWATHYTTGDFSTCRGHIDAGIAVYRNGDFRHHARLYGNHDALVCGLGALAQVEWMQGRPLSGLLQEEAAARWAMDIDHVGTKVHSLEVRILHRAHRRDYHEVFELSNDLQSLTIEHDLADHRAKALIFRGWVLAMHDDPTGGLRTLEEGLKSEREIGTLEDFPLYVCMQAEALARAGRPDVAVELLQRERQVFSRHGLLFWMPEVLRLLAETMLQSDPASISPARKLLEDAALLARTQAVPMLALRIALTMASIDDSFIATKTVANSLAAIAEDDGSADLAAARLLVKHPDAVATRLHAAAR